MELGHQLLTKQVHTMSVEQLRSLAMLQMPVLDLYQEVYNELEENPLLEQSEDHTEKVEVHKDDYSVEYRYKELIQIAEESTYKSCTYLATNDTQEQFSTVGSKKTLTEYLFEQLIELKIAKDIESICKFIIGNLDSRGFLDCSLNELADHMGVSQQKADDALWVVQNLQPVGIGSRNLGEYLLIQIRDMGIENDKLDYIVENGLTLIAENKIKALAKQLQTDIEEVAGYCSFIKSLNPFPAKGFNDETTHYIVPDAYVREIDGDLCVFINSEPIPSLKVSQVYKEILKSSDDSQEKAYIKEKMSKAVTFIRNIETRTQTLRKTFEAIVEIQEEYIRTSRNLKPMTLKGIAEKLEMHESTISRAIKGKYIMTPTRMLFVKDLFSSRLEHSGQAGEASSAEAKEAIKKIVAGENKESPYSDQQLSEMLKRDGYSISRRTVAKYREAMNIDSSAKRREF